MTWRWRAGLLGVLASLPACVPAPWVTTPRMLAYDVSLGVEGNALSVAWHGGNDGHDSLWIQPLDANDRATSAPLRLTDGTRDAFEPDLQLLDGDAVVAWYEKDEGGGLRAWVGRFDASGKARWREPVSAPGHQGRNTVVRVDDDGLHVAWLESARDAKPVDPVEVRTTILDGSGRRKIEPLVVGAASQDTWNLNAARAPDGTLLIVFDAHTASRAKELHVARVTGNASQVSPLGADDGFDSTYPDIALSRDRVALAWSDARDGNSEIYLAVGTMGDLTTDLARHTRRVTQTAGASIGAYLAWNGPRLLLAWCDDTPGQLEVFRQEFDARGQPVTPVEQITRTSTESQVPSVRAAGAGFALAWTERRALPATAPGGHSPTATSRVRVERVH